MPQGNHAARSRWPLYLKLVLAMFFWGGTWIAGRIIAQELPDPLGLAALRFLIAGLTLGLIARALGHPLTPPKPVHDRLALFGMGFFGIFLYGLCFFYGLRSIPAGQGALVVALNPVLAILLAHGLKQEHLSPVRWLGVALALAGSITVISHGNPLTLVVGDLGIGEALILGCAVTWTLYTFMGRQVSLQTPSIVVTTHACLTGACLLGAAALVLGETTPLSWSLPVWLSLLFLAFFGTAIAYTWFSEGVHRLGAGQASLFINLVPVFAVLQGAWLLDEHLSLPVLAGGLLVISGVWISSRRPM